MGGAILVVEDELITQTLIATNLERAGHRVMRALSVPEAEAHIRAALPDLVLLDWVLPDTTGVTFIRRLRTNARTRQIPVIMLTSRSDESDKVTGLEAGADDYITKPFSHRASSSRWENGLSLDPALHRVSAGGRKVELLTTEFRMLHFFMTHPERVYTRAQLLDEVWGDHVFVEERTVDVHIRRLRQTLQPTGHDALIETVRGTGYRFRRVPD